MRRSLVRGSIFLCAVVVLVPMAVSGLGASNDVLAGSGTDALGTGNKTSDVINISNERTSIYLSSQRVVVENGGEAQLDFSAVNYVTNERPMTVQLIFQAPSGVSVTGVDDVDEGDNQYVATRTLEPGGEFGTGIAIDPEKPGTYPVTAKAVYYFGTDRADGGGKEVELEITHRAPPTASSEKVVSSVTSAPSGLLSGFTDPFPAEYAPLFGSTLVRINVVYAFFDYLLLLFFLFILFDANSSSNDEDATFSVANTLSLVLTPILLAVGVTRPVLLVGIGLTVSAIALFVGGLLVQTLFG